MAGSEQAIIVIQPAMDRLVEVLAALGAAPQGPAPRDRLARQLAAWAAARSLRAEPEAVAGGQDVATRTPSGSKS